MCTAVPRGSFQGSEAETGSQAGLTLQELAALSPTSTKRRMLMAEAATIFEDADADDEGELTRNQLKCALQADQAMHRNCPTVLTFLCDGNDLDGMT